MGCSPHIGGMVDPKQVRLNDKNDPDRAHKFAKSLQRSGANGNAVIRHLVDAFIRYVDRHGHGPSFPIELTPPEKLKGQSA